MVDSYGGSDEVPLDERLFLGGGRTLRGFGYRDVGPKIIPAGSDASNEAFESIGGNTMLMGSVEYLVPINRLLRFATFADAGNVWEDSYDWDVSELAVSAGVGLRVDMPGFPIRIDYAWSMQKDDELTQEDPWVIYIGYD